MTKLFFVTLTGAQETPPITSAATGSGTVTWDPSSVTAAYSITVNGLDFGTVTGTTPQTPPTTDDVTNMHVHNQDRGVAGSVVFGQITPPHDTDDLQIQSLGNNSWQVSGIWETSDPTTTSISSFAPALSAAPIGSDVPLYFNVHTTPFPAGEIRGQWVATFDIEVYLSANRDVEEAGVDAFQHYLQFGWLEGRDVAPSFDTELYLQANPDVAQVGVNPLLHYVTFGKTEGRAIFEAIGRDLTEGFDREFYLLGNPDVGAAGLDALQHFRQFGWREGRDPNALFDTDGYLAANPDVAAAAQAGQTDPLRHYMSFGANEGRDPSMDFDSASYLAAYTDVVQAGMNPLDHYLRFGVYEGRQTFADGSFV
jgi:hypothetical protein